MTELNDDIDKYLDIKLNSMPEDELIVVCKKCGFLIEYVKNPSEELQLASIESNPDNIKLIKNLTEKVKSLALELMFSR
jgi:hypothetical protein